DIGLFIITRAIDGVVRTATYDGVPFLESREFEDELLRLVRGYLELPRGLEVRRPGIEPRTSRTTRTSHEAQSEQLDLFAPKAQ
ncbi:MAG TPA: hypothetical protein VGG92_20415, partial [Caulobacteraceae bacterium]